MSDALDAKAIKQTIVESKNFFIVIVVLSCYYFVDYDTKLLSDLSVLQVFYDILDECIGVLC